MSVTLAFIAASLAGAAQAQPSCWPTLTPPNISVARVQGKAPLGAIVYSASSAGMAWGWSCRAPDGSVVRIVVAGLWSEWAPDWAAIADALHAGTEADRQAAWRRYVNPNYQTPAALVPLIDAVKAALEQPADPPPPPPPPPPPQPGQWVVAPTSICAAADKDASGKCVRRQTYVWESGTRGLVATERVDIGAPCDLSVGAAGFYGVLGRADRVAPCVKR